MVDKEDVILLSDCLCYDLGKCKRFLNIFLPELIGTLVRLLDIR